MKKNSSKLYIKRIVVLALFCAMAYVTCFFLRISGIGGFLSFEIKDTVITLAAMLFGPWTGVAISFVVALMEMLSFSGTGPIGALMNFVSSAVFSACASTVYIYFPVIKKKISGAVVGLITAVIAVTVVMIPMNLIFTPLYQNVPVEVVKSMILPLLMPFNAIKATLNASLVMMLYKTVSVLLKRARVLDVAAHAPVATNNATANNNGYSLGKKSILIVSAAIAVCVVCVVLFLTVFGGEISWIRNFNK